MSPAVLLCRAASILRTPPPPDELASRRPWWRSLGRRLLHFPRDLALCESTWIIQIEKRNCAQKTGSKTFKVVLNSKISDFRNFGHSVVGIPKADTKESSCFACRSAPVGNVFWELMSWTAHLWFVSMASMGLRLLERALNNPSLILNPIIVRFPWAFPF